MEQAQRQQPSDTIDTAQPTSLIKREIRLDLIARSLVAHWRSYLLPCVVTFVLSCLLIVCIPRNYTVKVMLAPEASVGGGESSLASMASMVGVNLGGLEGGDAIAPMFYPDVMKSTAFIVPLLKEEVTTDDGSFKGPYGKYFTTVQTAPWWQLAAAWVVKALKSDAQKRKETGGKDVLDIDPFVLTPIQDKIITGVMSSVSSSVDKKTNVITLSATAQDPKVAAQLAQITSQHLQDFIIDYRTRKAKNDLSHYEQLVKQASKDYQEAQQKYSAYVDSHYGVVLSSYKTEEAALENEMQLAYNQYSMMRQQLSLAQAKVLERTPAFTILQNATVPVKPTGPKRMLFVVAMCFLAFIATSVYILVKDPSLKL